MCASMHAYIRIIKAGCYTGILIASTFDPHSLRYRMTCLKSDRYLLIDQSLVESYTYNS